MAFFCQICATKLVGICALAEELENSTVATHCGHLFHKKCLDASITNQKLIHASKGTGPFRKFCPAFNCANEISNSGVIEILTSHPKSPQGYTIPEEDDEIEIKIFKKLQVLMSEKERLLTNIEKIERENESYREAMDEIKAECEDITSFLLNDNMIKKGDRVFWVTKEGTFAPGRILEMRRKSNTTASPAASPYAIIKLDRKTKLPSMGGERETAVVPVTELLTFKSFFKDFFVEFRHKLWKILLETKELILTDEGRQKLLRSKFRESTLRLSIDSTASGRLSYLSTSHENIDSITIESVHNYNALGEQTQDSSRNTTKIKRAQSMNFGTLRSRSQTVDEKTRSTSCSNRISPLSENSVLNFEFSNSSVLQSPALSISPSPTYNYSNEEDNDDSPDYISEGERVIYYENNSKNPQMGVVVSVLRYTPCAIVKFEELPNEKQIYQFRTVSVSQLFPYALASFEEKFRIAELYEVVEDFIEQHDAFFSDLSVDINEEEEDEYEESVEEEYFSTGSTSADEISATIHDV